MLTRQHREADRRKGTRESCRWAHPCFCCCWAWSNLNIRHGTMATTCFSHHMEKYPDTRPANIPAQRRLLCSANIPAASRREVKFYKSACVRRPPGQLSSAAPSAYTLPQWGVPAPSYSVMRRRPWKRPSGWERTRWHSFSQKDYEEKLCTIDSRRKSGRRAFCNRFGDFACISRSCVPEL